LPAPLADEAEAGAVDARCVLEAAVQRLPLPDRRPAWADSGAGWRIDRSRTCGRMQNSRVGVLVDELHRIGVEGTVCTRTVASMPSPRSTQAARPLASSGANSSGPSIS
jgi:hypothetical protein